ALPVGKVPGIGKVTAEHMKRMGIVTCGDLRALTRVELLRTFGRFGERLYQLSRGEDEREVSVDRVRKSVSVEETYAVDLPDLTACLRELPELLQRLQGRLERAGNPVFRGIACKLKFADFSQTTVEQIGNTLDADHFIQLMQTGFARGGQPVRLLGVGVKLAAADEPVRAEQLPLFE
ncbi:MAG: DNA polymerase IV, partial [Paludibacterium sp.]|nr:DNA polymerase IV [Paludibacterium sp.]